MDTTITSESTDSGTAVTETPVQPTGTENAASENTKVEGGGEQSSTEGSQDQTTGGRKRWSMQDEVKELRAQRRELREQVTSFGQMQEELRQLREEMTRRNQPSGTAKTPANFWQDPEGRLQALRDELKEVVAEQNSGLMQAFHQTREQEYQLQALRQEQASATEFIRTQKGYDPSDDEELIDIIETIPKRTRENSSPQMVAEYAWMKLQAQRGVGDRGLARRQASGVQGQPPGVGFGRKTWNKQEFDQAVDLVDQKLRANPNDAKMNELFDELQSAHKEGRVK